VGKVSCQDNLEIVKLTKRRILYGNEVSLGKVVQPKGIEMYKYRKRGLPTRFDTSARMLPDERKKELGDYRDKGTTESRRDRKINSTNIRYKT
jgi:hypothetical protein